MAWRSRYSTQSGKRCASPGPCPTAAAPVTGPGGAHCHGSSLTVALDKRRQVECNDSSLLACLRRAQHPEVERLQAIEHNAGRGTAQTSRIYTETSAVSPSIWRSRGDLSSAAEITDPL